MNQSRLRFIGLFAGITACLLMAAFLSSPGQQVANGQGAGYSLRFYGHGVDDIDRVKIPVYDPARSSVMLPTNIGATDFTMEFWIRGTAEENPVGTVNCGANENWIYGRVVVDRDRFSLGRKFGLSIGAGGRVAFGITNEQRAAVTICSNVGVLDGAWHHVAVQRRAQDGRLWLYVDGALATEASGPTGNVSYPLNTNVSFQGPQYCRGPQGAWGGNCRNEPYFVLGAEKHDAGADAGTQNVYPSFSGWMDEFRLSDRLRYSSNFTVPTLPFVADTGTVGLYHFDEGPEGPCTGTVNDNAQTTLSPINGTCSHGGQTPAGPTYSTLTPFTQGSQPTSTVPPSPTALPTALPTASPTAMPTMTPTLMPTPTTVVTPTTVPTATPVATATATPLPTATPVATATAIPLPTATPVTGNSALRFDGADDQVFINAGVLSQPFTMELWMQPDSANMEAVVLIKGDAQAGWSLELNAGRPTYWQATAQGWVAATYPTSLQPGRWYHIAATYNQGQVQIFVDGVPGARVNLGAMSQTGNALTLGGIQGYSFYTGRLDDLRLSSGIRYTNTFVPPATLGTPDATVLGQWSFDDGSGALLSDGTTNANHGRLGVEGQQAQTSPQWVIAQR